MTGGSPFELVALARAFTHDGDRRLGASRYLAAVLLVRQALETALDGLWDRKAPGLAACTSRAQLVSLPYFLDDQGLAGEVVHCWYRLTRACHHDEYDLPPTQGEVEHLSRVVERLVCRHSGGRIPVTFLTHQSTTAARIEQLQAYMNENVLGPHGFVCCSEHRCRASATLTRSGVPTGNEWWPGQLSHVGHHYDLEEDGQPLRGLVIATEAGHPPPHSLGQDRR